MSAANIQANAFKRKHRGTLPAYLSSLGLTREPFADAIKNDFFYNEPIRAQRLKLLLHLAAFGDVLLVIGEHGSGKTCLLHQFLDQTKQPWRICPINADADVTSETILQSLAREFAQDVTDDTPLDDQIKGLRVHFRALKRSAQIPILLIDEAHELSEEVLITLAKLIEFDADDSKLLTIILFCEPSIEEKLAQPALESVDKRVSHSFDLPPFNEQDTRNYIAHRLKVAGLTTDSPFTLAVIKVIHGTSRGVPGHINELAQVVLQNSAMAVDPSALPFDAPSRTVEIKRYWPIVVLVFLLVVIFFAQESLTSIFGSDSDVTQEILPSENDVQVFDGPITRDNGIVGNDASDQTSNVLSIDKAAVITSDSGTDIGQNNNEDVATQTEPDEIIANEPQLDTSSVQADDLGESGISSKITNPDIVNKATTSITAIPDVIEAQPAQNIPAEPETIVKLDEANTAAVSATLILPNESSQADATHSAEIKKPSTAQSTTQQDQIKRESWLLARTPTNFTVQLMAIREEATILRFIKIHDLEASGAYFTTLSKGAEWRAVVLGDYPTRTAAVTASIRLPKGMIGIKPWVRSFASVQAAIKIYQDSL